MNVLGKGNLKLMVNRIANVINEMFYIPELKNNLMSLGQFQERGLAIVIQSGMCQIYHLYRGLIIQTNMTANRMFVLFAQTQDQSESYFNTIAQDITQLWYRRYTHISYKGLKTLQSKEMVKDLPELPDSTICVLIV